MCVRIGGGGGVKMQKNEPSSSEFCPLVAKISSDKEKEILTFLILRTDSRQITDSGHKNLSMRTPPAPFFQQLVPASTVTRKYLI